MPPDIKLRVSGQEYSGWKTARVTRGIEAVAGGFELGVSDRWAGQEKPWPIREEDECALFIGGKQIIKGVVDKRAPSFGSREHSLKVSGRDKTAEMIDCSADVGVWEFVNTNLLALASQLASPYGIDVSMQPGIDPPAPVARLTIDPGETSFEALERACRLAGMLAVSDGDGGLVLTRAGTARCGTSLVQGENILSASGNFDSTGRFRHYKVLAQHQGSESLYSTQAAGISGTAEDSGVRRASRSLIIRADGNASQAQARTRAQWEAIVRAARGQAFHVTVQGWTQGDGSLWPINALVHLKSEYLEVDSDVLISEATYSLEAGGTTTQLTLKRPDAFKPKPTVAVVNSGLWSELGGAIKVTQASAPTPASFPHDYSVKR